MFLYIYIYIYIYRIGFKTNKNHYFQRIRRRKHPPDEKFSVFSKSDENLMFSEM